MLNRHDSLEDRAMVDVRQVREFARFRREHGSVKHHIVILDAGHVQGCVIAPRLDADIAFPSRSPRNIPGEFGIQFQRSES
jgi:hypothetical protein